MKIICIPFFKPALAALAAAFLVVSLLCPAGAQAQTSTANITLAINTAQAQTKPIPSDFSGLSFEMGSVIFDSVNNGWYLSGSNSDMIALVKTLGVKSIRVGGNSAETGNIATAADEDAVLDFCHAVGANLIWDLEVDGALYDPSNLASDPTGKPVIAQSMQNYVNARGYQTNTNTLVFQVGNEPDLTAEPGGTGNKTDTTYDSEFSSYIAATNALYSGSRWAGPDTAGGGTFYSSAFCPAEGPTGQVAYVCQHLYPFGSSLTAGTIAAQISLMLSAGNETGYAGFMTQWVPPATAAGLVTRYEECNSYFHNGSFGSSNAYASALWGLGWMYFHANAGLGGINFHTGLNSNNPAYSFVTPANLTTSYTVHPLAYAIEAFNQGGHGSIVPVTIGNSSNANVVAYSVLQSDGSLVVTVINRENGSPAFNAALSITTSGATYNDGQVMFLTGSNNDPTTTTGVLLGGSAISPQGVWTGTYMGMARPSGSFVLTVPATQAAIIRLFAANGPTAPANLTAAAGNSQATLNWNVSTSATSYVIERSTVTGGPYTTVATGVTTHSYIDTGLANGFTYYYVVAANNSNGVGPQSAEANTTLPQQAPLPPAGLTAIPGDSVVALSWNVSVGATNYILESSTSSNGTYSLITSTQNTSYLNNGLTDGKTYYYTVAAVGPYGQSLPSAAVSATPFASSGIGWLPVATGSAQSWNVNSNWSTAAYPNAPQAAALVNSAIAASQTINVNQAITIGELNLGASSGGGSFTLAGNGGTLTFANSPAPGSVQQLPSSKGDIISAPLALTGDLDVNNASTNPLTFSGNISGTNDLVFNSGAVALSGATTYNGTTTVAGGTLQLANSLALQDSTFNPVGGSVAFSGITTATLGGLIGTLNLNLANTASAAVALTVGSSNLNTTYAGAFTGPGSLTKAGTGILTLTGTNNHTGATTVSSGNLTIAGGTFGSSGGTITVGTGTEGVSFNVTGGLATAGTINIAPSGGSTGDNATITGSGSAAFANVNIGSGSNTSGGLSINTTGTASLGVVAVVRDTGAGAGLAVQGGTVTATSVDVQANSDKVSNMDISGGNLTIGTSSSTNAFKVGDGGDGGFLTMTGGSLTYLGKDGLLVTTAATIGSASITSGTTTLTGITMNSGGSTTATSTLTLGTGATLYLGSVGLVAKLPDPGVSISFGADTVGAIANWSSVAPITLTGTTTFQTSDASSTAHNISLGGALSGAGGVIATGDGLLTLSGSSSYSGATTVAAGTLILSGTLKGGNVEVQNAATFSLSAGNLTAATTTIDAGGTLIGCGTINGAVVNNGTVLSECGGVLTISGNVTNTGTMRITNGGTLSVGGTFTNKGILDLMTGAPALPANFVNKGTVLDSSLVKVSKIGMASNVLTISIQTYSGHTYQLQSEASLNSTWAALTNNVTTQTDGNGVMTFTVTSVVGASQFYRIQAGP